MERPKMYDKIEVKIQTAEFTMELVSECHRTKHRIFSIKFTESCNLLFLCKFKAWPIRLW